MKNLLILLAIPLFFISCVRNNDGTEENNLVSFDVSMSMPSFDVYGTDKSTSSQSAKSSSFQHIFRDEIDVVFTSTTSDFTAILTINPNDLSNSPSIDLAYGTYSWTISTNLSLADGIEYYFPEYLPVYGSGSVEVFSSNISLDLLVDTDYGLVTVQKENIDSAKIALDIQIFKNLILNGNSYYTYVTQRNIGYAIEIEENKYNTTITTPVGETGEVLSKTHYNYILAFSDVDVNSLTLKTAAFEQIDYYLQPTATVSSTCVIAGSIRGVDQFNEVSFTMTASNTLPADIVFDFATTCSETLNVVANNLPEGLTLTDYNSSFKTASLTGVVSATASGTYNYTITAFNSDNINTATASGTVTGTIIVTGLNPIYLDDNGVTIKAYDWAEVGDKGIINGIEYTVVNNLTIEGELTDNNINLCTTLVTNMSNLFKDKTTFSSDIGFWDTSNVNSMGGMFFRASSFNQDLSGWCVDNISSEPSNFSLNSVLENSNKPIWGTCPE